MSYSIFTVANTILEKAVSEDETLTHMKLQKMAYCLHGWHLAILDTPACVEPVEAWKYGPVWGSLYHALKHNGHDPIRHFIGAAGEIVEQGGHQAVPTATDREFHETLEKVWRKYAPFSANKLSNMTHQPGTPWAKARHCGTPFIDNDEIKKHFREEVVGGLPHA